MTTEDHLMNPFACLSCESITGIRLNEEMFYFTCKRKCHTMFQVTTKKKWITMNRLNCKYETTKKSKNGFF